MKRNARTAALSSTALFVLGAGALGFRLLASHEAAAADHAPKGTVNSSGSAAAAAR